MSRIVKGGSVQVSGAFDMAPIEQKRALEFSISEEKSAEATPEEIRRQLENEYRVKAAELEQLRAEAEVTAEEIAATARAEAQMTEARARAEAEAYAVSQRAMIEKERLAAMNDAREEGYRLAEEDANAKFSGLIEELQALNREYARKI